MLMLGVLGCHDAVHFRGVDLVRLLRSAMVIIARRLGRLVPRKTGLRLLVFVNDAIFRFVSTFVTCLDVVGYVRKTRCAKQEVKLLHSSVVILTVHGRLIQNVLEGTDIRAIGEIVFLSSVTTKITMGEKRDFYRDAPAL